MASTQDSRGFCIPPLLHISHREQSLGFSGILVLMSVCKHAAREGDLGDNNSVDPRVSLM